MLLWCYHANAYLCILLNGSRAASRVCDHNVFTANTTHTTMSLCGNTLISLHSSGIVWNDAGPTHVLPGLLLDTFRRCTDFVRGEFVILHQVVLRRVVGPSCEEVVVQTTRWDYICASVSFLVSPWCDDDWKMLMILRLERVSRCPVEAAAVWNDASWCLAWLCSTYAIGHETCLEWCSTDLFCQHNFGSFTVCRRLCLENHDISSIFLLLPVWHLMSSLA